MSTAVITTPPAEVAAARPARTITPIPMSRLVKVELRKTFDTRAGFWLMASVGILAVLAPVAAARIDDTIAAGREQGTALVLDAKLPPLDKLKLAEALVGDLDPVDAGGDREVDRRRLGRVQHCHRAGGCLRIGDTVSRGDRVPHGEPRPPLVVGDVPHVVILPGTGRRDD